MSEKEHWKWQEPGGAWKNVGLYHITLTVTGHLPLLGQLVIPDGQPKRAMVVRSTLGDALVDCLISVPQHHTEVHLLHFCMMPDHLHAVLYVHHTMPKGIRAVVRGFWQATKKLGRACSVSGPSFFAPNDIRDKLKEGSVRLRTLATTLSEKMDTEAYYRQDPIFRDKPFIRPMTHYSQLPNTIRYIDMNPQRSATKRLKPGFFRVQKGIAIGNRCYDGVGNVALLMEGQYTTVHVRRMWVEKAHRGFDQELRDYKNTCVLNARNRTVMVSPFISPDEKEVMQVLLREQHPLTHIAVIIHVTA